MFVRNNLANRDVFLLLPRYAPNAAFDGCLSKMMIQHPSLMRVGHLVTNIKTVYTRKVRSLGFNELTNSPLNKCQFYTASCQLRKFANQTITKFIFLRGCKLTQFFLIFMSNETYGCQPNVYQECLIFGCTVITYGCHMSNYLRGFNVDYFKWNDKLLHILNTDFE